MTDNEDIQSRLFDYTKSLITSKSSSSLEIQQLYFNDLIPGKYRKMPHSSIFLGVLMTRQDYSLFRASLIDGNEKVCRPKYHNIPPWTSSLPKAKSFALSRMKSNQEVAVVLSYSCCHHEIVFNVSGFVKENEDKFTEEEVNELKSLLVVNVERPLDFRVRWTNLS